MLFFFLLSDIETISFFIQWMSSIVERFSINWQKTGWKWRKKKPFEKQNIFFSLCIVKWSSKTCIGHSSNKKSAVDELNSFGWTNKVIQLPISNGNILCVFIFFYDFSFSIFFYTLLLNDHIVLRGNDSRMLETLITIGFWYAYTANIAKVKEIYK